MALLPPHFWALLPAQAMLHFVEAIGVDAGLRTLPARHCDAYSRPKYCKLSAWAFWAHRSMLMPEREVYRAVRARVGLVSA